MSVISFTKLEESLLREALSSYCDFMNDSENTSEELRYQMQNGLGSVMFKLWKGRKGQKLYEKYKK